MLTTFEERQYHGSDWTHHDHDMELDHQWRRHGIGEAQPLSVVPYFVLLNVEYCRHVGEMLCDASSFDRCHVAHGDERWYCCTTRLHLLRNVCCGRHHSCRMYCHIQGYVLSSTHSERRQSIPYTGYELYFLNILIFLFFFFNYYYFASNCSDRYAQFPHKTHATHMNEIGVQSFLVPHHLCLEMILINKSKKYSDSLCFFFRSLALASSL